MKLINWAQYSFLAGISLLIIRNNYFPWPIKRSSDILFLLSFGLILASIAINKDWKLVLKIIKRMGLPFIFIFVGLLIASLNGYFLYGIKVDSEGWLALFRLVEATALVFSIGFLQNYDLNFYKKAAVAQLSTIVYLVGYFGVNHLPNFTEGIGRFTLFENFPSNVGYYLLASLSLIYIRILDNSFPFNRKFVAYLILGISLTGIMIWTGSRGAWVGLLVAILIIFSFWFYKQRQDIKKIILGITTITFCLTIGFLLLPATIKNQSLLRFSTGENSRVYLWRNYGSQLMKNPLGFGLSFPTIEYENSKKGPHNTLLEFWAMGGLLAVAGFLAIYYRGLKNIFLQRQLYLIASLIALFTASLFDNMNSFRLMWILIGLAIFHI